MTVSPLDRLTMQSDAYRDRLTRRAAYSELVARLHLTVPAILPPSACVLVVSRGDDELLGIPGMQGRHFPQAADGRYAGHYPADSEAAIEHLEAHQRGGATHLLFPATSMWWLEHYEGLRRYLDDKCEVIRRDEDCVIYWLATGPTSSENAPAASEHWCAVSALLDAVLPEDAEVLILTAAPTATPDRIGHRAARISAVSADEDGRCGRADYQQLGIKTAKDAATRPRFVLVPHGLPGTCEDASYLLPLDVTYRIVLRHRALCTVLEIANADDRSIRHLSDIRSR